ncbi:MAG: DnaD domain protein [Niameybacter sp.]|uniref:DnaD domain protein n=1 Tax=Niameybacter sp. TaxID=2033640 RepID=UPI002FC91C1C
MAYVKFIPNPPASISIPYWFITTYMPQALGGYVKVYLYLFALYQDHSLDSISLEDCAKVLDMLYSELISALDYWHTQKVVDFILLSDDEYELTFSLTQPAASINTEVTASVETKTQRTFVQQTRPHYTSDELTLYCQEHSSIANLFTVCEKHLGRLLSSTDQQVLYGLYDWLNLPLDLIEYLVQYCASNNHTHIRYIEKVALGWVDQGIKCVEDAKAQASITKQYRTILKALGMTSETITRHQKELLDKWLNDYAFDLSVILEACNRTVTYSSSPSLNYLGSILDKWQEKNIRTLEDITKLDQTHSKEQEATKTKNGKATKSKNPHFTTTYSHNWDLDELEKRERQYLEEQIYGGN